MSDAPPKQSVTGTDSVRMDNDSHLPPYSGADAGPVPVTSASAGAGMSASAALVSMHNAASQSGGDAFPVLKAFQDYLESERQRARHRMMTLSIVFAVVIVAVVGAFTLFWYSSMRGVQDTNRQLLEAALKRASEPPAPVIVQPPQPSAADTAKVIAEAVAKAQAEQTATFAKTLEGLNASLETMRQENAGMKAEIERAKAAAEKDYAERLAAEKAADERATTEEKARTAKKSAAPAAVQSPTPKDQGPVRDARVASATPPAVPSSEADVQDSGGDALVASAAPPQQPELQIPKYNAPPPPAGFSPDVMAVRLPKEPRPISWRVYVPMRAE